MIQRLDMGDTWSAFATQFGDSMEVFARLLGSGIPFVLGVAAIVLGFAGLMLLMAAVFRLADIVGKRMGV